MQALAELARRYFRSRGPASVHDLAKWSGLTVAEARRGLEAVKCDFHNQAIGGKSLSVSRALRQARRTTPEAYLLSIYDEFVSGYKDHHAAATDEIAARLKSLGNALTHIMFVSDQFVAPGNPSLRRTPLVRARPFASLSSTETQALAKAASKYGEFLALKGKLSMEFNTEA